MVSKDKGFVCLWRTAFDDDIWLNDRPKDIFSAWMYLIAHANYKENNVYSKNVERGQHWTSITKLAIVWHIDKRRVKEYLDEMQRDGKIVWELYPNKGVMITVMNYDKYQGFKK